MTERPTIQAAKDGWFTLDQDKPRLLGQQCAACKTFFFPPTARLCLNPGCFEDRFETVELSNTGTVWSYTSASYPPPPPYIAADPFVPFGIVAVHLEREDLVVLGQLCGQHSLDELQVGAKVELTLETLYKNDDEDVVVWKWKPVSTEEALNGK